MASVEVMILVKAPNQLIDDQEVICQRSWTVRRLKEHLHDVYPSKPMPNEQKLIYSGQLLSDSTVLSDVIKSYNGHEINIIHLVCAMKHNAGFKMNPPVLNPPPIPSRPPQNSSSPLFLNNTSANNTSVPPETRAHNPNYFQNYQTWHPNMFDANYMAQNQNLFNGTREEQFDWMQRAYFNYLFNHYLLMSEWRSNPQSSSQIGLDQSNSSSEGEPFPADRDVHGDPQGYVQPPPQQNADEENDEDGHINRDLLEWIYIYFRFGVFFMFVYFYSSPIRFLLVVTMMVLLFYIDIERYRQRNGAQDPPAPEDGEQRAEEDVSENQPPQPRNNWLSTAWTFVSLFFLSLIPDIIIY